MRSNRPYVQLDPAVIEQARQMDLLTYLQHYEPSNLRRVAGNVYCTAFRKYSPNFIFIIFSFSVVDFEVSDLGAELRQ